MSEPEVYSGPERRRLETIQMEAIEAVVERLMAKLIAQHENNERAMWEDWMSRAFPGGNPDAHKVYHQSKIDAATADHNIARNERVGQHARRLRDRDVVTERIDVADHAGHVAKRA